MHNGATNGTRARISSGVELVRLALAAAFAITASGGTASAIAAPRPPVLVPAGAQDLCVTEGKVAALKLKAQDACNLLYAMWRIEPEAKLVVSVKTNPDEHSSAECGNRGYRNVKPDRSAPVPILRPGDTHVLRAELGGTSMRVLIDGHPVWEGEVGAEALRLKGPVGLRSDNARLEIDLRTAAPLAGAAVKSKACSTGGAESE